MTQEEKARAYDEAIKKAKSKIKNDKDHVLYEDDILDIFSELKNNDDERIKQEVISAINLYCTTYLRGDIRDKMLAWVEKQGEQRDLVIQKFKVGDWVVSPIGVYWHIDRIENNRYEVTSNTGKCADWPLNTDLYHLWTIEDAKDGDILFSRSSFIYGKQCPYGGLDWYTNKFIKASNFIFKDGPVHPATKEQRNILFKKMKEAGYEWDAEKKKLKKIITPIFNIGDRVRYKDCMCDGVITEITDTDYICGNAKLPISTQDKLELIEHNPVK